MTAPAQPKNRTFPLLLLAMALGGLVYWDRFASAPDTATDIARPQRGGNPQQPGTVTRASPVVRSGEPRINPLSDIRLDQLEATVKRPLFETSRRAYVPPPAPRLAPPPPKTTAPPPPTPAFRLLGVVASGGRSFAIVTHPGRATPMRLEAGDFIEGWQIERIEPNRVVLVRSGQKKQLDIFPRVE